MDIFVFSNSEKYEFLIVRMKQVFGLNCLDELTVDNLYCMKLREESQLQQLLVKWNGMRTKQKIEFARQTIQSSQIISKNELLHVLQVNPKHFELDHSIYQEMIALLDSNNQDNDIKNFVEIIQSEAQFHLNHDIIPEHEILHNTYREWINMYDARIKWRLKKVTAEISVERQRIKTHNTRRKNLLNFLEQFSPTK
jgi:hypothetical protein